MCSPSSSEESPLTLLVVEVAVGVLSLAALSPAVASLVDARCSARRLIDQHAAAAGGGKVCLLES